VCAAPAPILTTMLVKSGFIINYVNYLGSWVAEQRRRVLVLGDALSFKKKKKLS
jgi:hypothetical protein